MDRLCLEGLYAGVEVGAVVICTYDELMCHRRCSDLIPYHGPAALPPDIVDPPSPF